MTTTRLLPALLAATAVVLTSLAPSIASAEEEDVLENAAVVRRQLQYRASRHEVTGLMGMSLAEPYVQTILPGARYDYHWRDWLSFGGRLQVGIPFLTQTYDQIDLKVARSNETFVMEATSLRIVALGHVSATPFIGKVMMFDSLPVNFDVHIDLSAGLVNVASTGDQIAGTGFGFTGGIGGGMRIFFSRVIALTGDFQALVVDRAMSVNRDSKEAGGKSRFNGIFSAGISFFMPPELKRAD